MNRYVLLRILTEPSKEPTMPDEIVVKFFPVKNNHHLPQIVIAESPEDAFAQIRKTPGVAHLAHFFAIEPEERYNATVKRLAELSAKRRGNPGGKSQSSQRRPTDAQPRLESADSLG